MVCRAYSSFSRNSHRAALFVFCLACNSAAFSETPTSVSLVAEDSWPPYSDSQGRGLSNELVSAAYNLVGIETQIAVMPYARVEHQVQAGKFDGGFNVTRQASTEELFVFGQQPLLSAPASFFFRRAEGQTYSSYEDVPDGIKIGLIIGYEYGDIYQQNKHRFVEIRVSQQQQIIRMLMAGRIDAAIMFDEVAAYNLRRMGLETDRIDKAFQNHVSEIYVGFSLKNDRSAHYAERLDKGLLNLKASGEYQKIVDRHFKDE